MSERYVPGFDDLAPGEVSARIHSLDVSALEALVEHERQHAARPAILQVLERRLEAVREGAPLGGGDPTSEGARAAAAPPADPASPQTEGPPQNPPSQGVPTNPAQPRS